MSDPVMTRHIRDLIKISTVLDRYSPALDPDVIAMLSKPFIDGIEVTQAIQYYKAAGHLTNSNDQGPDNSVRLVANKPAWVRLYVRHGILGGNVTVTGEIEIRQHVVHNYPIWNSTGTLAPAGAASVATQNNPIYATERLILGSTLNFIVPENLMFGNIHLIARIWTVGGSAAAPADTQEIALDVTLSQMLHLRGVLISYNGPDPTANPPAPNINLPAPSLTDLQATAAWTLTTNPVQSQAVYSSAGTLAWSTPLTGLAIGPGDCSVQWKALNAAVAQAVANDGNRTDVVYYGLLPAGIPIANVAGCGGFGIGTGSNGDQVTMTHEIGHAAGLSHGPCGTPGDPNYPAYEPYDPNNTPTASLGEYGLDINNGAIHPPAEKDYMSYCGPKWISLYHHGRLINNSRYNPQTVGVHRWRPPDLVDPYLWPWEYIPDPPPWERTPGEWIMKPQRVISIIGLMDEERQLQVQSVMRVTALPAVQNGLETSFVAQLIGVEGNVVVSTPVFRIATQGCGCGGDCGGGSGDGGREQRNPFAFQALLPDVEPGSGLRILRRGRHDEEDKEAWARRAPVRPPEIRGFEVRVSKRALTLRWEADGAGEQPLEFTLQHSKDGGRSWNGLAVGLRENGYEGDPAGLPGGMLTFRLLAHDGFFTTTTESEPIRMPERPPTVSILHPQEGPSLIADFPMRLWGAVSSASGARIDSGACRWLVDGEEAGRGIDTWIKAPKAGEHSCTFIVDAAGETGEARLTFTTIDPPRLDGQQYVPVTEPPAPRAPRLRRPRKPRG